MRTDDVDANWKALAHLAVVLTGGALGVGGVGEHNLGGALGAAGEVEVHLGAADGSD